MNKKNIIIIILIILIIGLTGFIVYDKVLSDNKCNQREQGNSDESTNNIDNSNQREYSQHISLATYEGTSIEMKYYNELIGELTLDKEGNVYIENDAKKQKLNLKDKILYAEKIQNGIDDIYSIFMVSKNNNLYEYKYKEYQKENYTPVLIKENIRRIAVVSLPGEYEYASGYITKLIGFTTSGETINIKLER